MNFTRDLDKYLTSEPPDDYTPWVEAVWNLIHEDCISSEEYDENQAMFGIWEDYLNRKGYTPLQAAQLIAKTFKYKKILAIFKENGPGLAGIYMHATVKETYLSIDGKTFKEL